MTIENSAATVSTGVSSPARRWVALKFVHDLGGTGICPNSPVRSCAAHHEVLRDGALRRLRLVQPRQGQADRGGAAVGDAEARQALVPAPGAAGVPRRHQPVGDAEPVAVDRAGARAIALSDPARLAGGRGLALGQQGGRLLARAQERRHAADRGDRRRRSPGTKAPGDFGRREGTPLPPALAGRFASEPKWVDLRAYRDGADTRDARFIELGADFAAAIHGMPKEDLLSQEVRQQRRALTLAWSAAGSLLVLAGLAGWQWKAAVDAERLAVEQKQHRAAAARPRRARRCRRRRRPPTISCTSWRSSSATRKGMPIELVRSVLEQAQELQRKLAERGESTPLLRDAEGAALNELAIALQEIGDLKTALEAAERARALVEKAVAEEPTILSWRENLAISHETVGNILRGMGRHDEALESYRKSLAISERLAADHPTTWNGRRTWHRPARSSPWCWTPAPSSRKPSNSFSAATRSGKSSSPPNRDARNGSGAWR